MNRFGVNILQGPSEIKDVDTKQGVVISYPSTFDVIDSGKDRVRKGAFNRTINSWGPNGKKRIKVLFNHEPWSMIGKPLALKEDDYGLYAESKIVPTNLGKDILLLLENEVITEQSIGYSAVREEHDDESGIRDLLEVKLYEYSFLAWGMNEQTPIIGTKAQHHAADVALSMKRLQKVLEAGEFSTEDVPEMLTRVLKQWQDDLREMEDSIVRVDTSTLEGVRDGIKRLESLLPEGSPEGTPEEQDPVQDATDSGSHSEALGKLLTRLKSVNERQDAELAAITMLREFQRKLASHA